MIKREAKFTTLFRHWLKANPIFESAAFELKQTQKDYISFSAVKDHQLWALMAAHLDKGILYKAPDDSRGVKPFDLFFLKNAGAYVVIRYPKCFVIIEIMQFVNEKINSNKHSLHVDRAREISFKFVDL